MQIVKACAAKSFPSNGTFLLMGRSPPALPQEGCGPRLSPWAGAAYRETRHTEMSISEQGACLARPTQPLPLCRNEVCELSLTFCVWKRQAQHKESHFCSHVSFQNGDRKKRNWVILSYTRVRDGRRSMKMICFFVQKSLWYNWR